MRALRWILLIASSVINIVIVLLVIGFSVGCYRWAFKINRAQPQNINPIMYPSFTLVNVSEQCCASDPYYRLWRTYDWVSDGHARERRTREYIRVPVVYVHGNGGHYYCARSLARFLYDSNVRQRRAALHGFEESVKEALIRTRDDEIRRAEVGAALPSEVVRQAEEDVVRSSIPLLATELFAVDYLEESFAHSGVLAVKEARFLNHSMHLLYEGFLRTYQPVLDAPVSSVFDTHSLDGGEEARAAFHHHFDYPVSEAQSDYVQSLCSQASAASSPELCSRAVAHMTRFSSLERIRAEVQRVKEQGLWLWAESLGGTVSVFAAIMNPSLYAGIVLVGSPTRYPPLFFDVPTMWFYRIMSDAVLRHYPCLQTQVKKNWEKDVLPHQSPLGLLHNLMELPVEEISARLCGVTLLSINGGALDDVVPSITGYFHRSTPRHRDDPSRAALMQWSERSGGTTRTRRDISTETLRGCGLPVDHRGIVYGLQLLNTSADSLVDAVVLPDSDKFFDVEARLPQDGPRRDRLFPTIVETLSPQARKQTDNQLLARSIERTESGQYKKKMNVADVAGTFTEEVCVNSATGIDVMELPTAAEESDMLSGYYNGEVPLHVFLGFTTHDVREVMDPRLDFFDENHIAVSDDAVLAEPVTRLHLPYIRKDSKVLVNGRTLRTAVSFRVTRAFSSELSNTVPSVLYPRFCFRVLSNNNSTSSSSSSSPQHHTYFQHDRIDASVLHSKRRELYFGPHYIGNRVRLEHHKGYSLIDGVDSFTQERGLHVSTAPGSEVFPVTICGTLHSFLLMARGSAMTVTDDPEDQLQYFFGPHYSGLNDFRYSWKAFSAFEGDLNETYMVYTLGDNTQRRPSIVLTDLSARADASLLSLAYWFAWVEQGPERWLAYLSGSSGLGKIGGSYAFIYLVFYIFTGRVRMSLYTNQALQPAWRFAWLQTLCATSPLVVTVLSTVTLEFVTATIVSMAMPVCRAAQASPFTTNDEMNSAMSLMERGLVLLLFWLPPNFRECQYPWIRMQAVPAWPSFLEHVATICIGFILAILLLTIGILIFCVCHVASYPLHKLVFRPLFRFPRVAGAVLLAVWLVPIATLWTMPYVPHCYRHLGSVMLAMCIIGIMPRRVGSGYNFVSFCKYICVVAIFPAHFDGLALVIRNHVIMRRNPEGMWDAERYLLATPQLVVFALSQIALGACYVTTYLVTLHDRGVHRHKTQKESGGEAEKPLRDVYTLGDVGRAFTWVRPLMKTAGPVLMFVALWAAEVALRRPLEGSISLVGNMVILFHLLADIVIYW